MESGLETWSFQEDMWPPSAHAAATRAQPHPEGQPWEPTPPLLPQFNPQRLLPVASHVHSPSLCWDAGTPHRAAP